MESSRGLPATNLSDNITTVAILRMLASVMSVSRFDEFVYPVVTR